METNELLPVNAAYRVVLYSRNLTTLQAHAALHTAVYWVPRIETVAIRVVGYREISIRFKIWVDDWDTARDQALDVFYDLIGRAGIDVNIVSVLVTPTSS